MYHGSNVLLKFYKPNGEAFSIGSEGNWRFSAKSGLSGFATANGNVTFTDNVNDDGGQIERVRFTKVDRTIKTVYLFPNNNEQARRQFTAFFTPRIIYRVYLTYMGSTKWAYAQLTKMKGSEDTNEHNLMSFQMTFTFANPFWMSVDDFGKDIAAVTGMTAFPYLSKMVVGKPTGVFNFSREVTLANNGDIEAKPRIFIMAKDTVVNPVVRINDGFVRIVDTLEQGDEIAIDFTATPATVKKNGVNAFGKCDRTSNFVDMVLKVGDNVASFDADNGSNELAVTIYYNKLYTVV